MVTNKKCFHFSSSLHKPFTEIDQFDVRKTLLIARGDDHYSYESSGHLVIKLIRARVSKNFSSG